MTHGGTEKSLLCQVSGRCCPTAVAVVCCPTVVAVFTVVSSTATAAYTLLLLLLLMPLLSDNFGSIVYARAAGPPSLSTHNHTDVNEFI